MEDFCNIADKCRLCAAEESIDVDVLQNTNLVDDILNFTTILIDFNDTLPTKICTNCNATLEYMKNFRENCISVQETLFAELNNMDLIEVLEGSDNDEDDSLSHTEKQTYNEDFQENEEMNSVNQSQDSQDLCEPTVQDDTASEEPSKKATKTKKLKYRQLSKEERHNRYIASLYPCDQCGKMIEKSRVEGHVNQHLGVKPYICNINDCNKSFSCFYNLKNHKRYNHSSELHECDICGKTYNLLKSLYNHKLKHQTPKYACSMCDRVYKNSTYLKQHMRTHTGERPYRCQYCERAFATTYNLKAHIRTHTKEKPFSCNYCPAAYGYNSLLKLHIEKRHSDLPS